MNPDNLRVVNEAVDALIAGIKVFVDEKLKKAPFDKTLTGIVTGIIEKNVYRVLIKGIEQSVPCCTEQTFKVGDTVLILVVQNNYSNKYIIGKNW